MLVMLQCENSNLYPDRTLTLTPAVSSPAGPLNPGILVTRFVRALRGSVWTRAPWLWKNFLIFSHGTSHRNILGSSHPYCVLGDRQADTDQMLGEQAEHLQCGQGQERQRLGCKVSAGTGSGCHGWETRKKQRCKQGQVYLSLVRLSWRRAQKAGVGPGGATSPLPTSSGPLVGTF